MSEEQLIPMLPKLQVLARSSPSDKLILVRLLKKQGEVVAVTGSSPELGAWARTSVLPMLRTGDTEDNRSAYSLEQFNIAGQPSQ